MRVHAGVPSDAEREPDSPEAGVAHRAAGYDLLVRRRVREARDHWNGRSPCSDPAATTIWPFGSA